MTWVNALLACVQAEDPEDPVNDPDGPVTQHNPVTAIDVLLEPDDTMVAHAAAVNARLRTDFPDGFELDAAHHPHITMLQRFVRTADLDEVYAAAETVLADENRPRGR